jgi:hypothetical protein
VGSGAASTIASRYSSSLTAGSITAVGPAPTMNVFVPGPVIKLGLGARTRWTIGDTRVEITEPAPARPAPRIDFKASSTER